MRHLLTDRRCAELDLLLVPGAYLGRTPLAWLGVGPTSSSPAAVKAELEKLAYLRRLDAHTVDLSMLPTERRRFLAGIGRRLTGQALQRREPERRYPILLTLLAQSAVDVLDETLLLFDQAISGREAAAKQKVAEVLAERAGRRLTRAIAGRGAFRRFKDELHEEYPHLLPAWHAFHDVRARRRAVMWLVDNSLVDDEVATRFVAEHPDPELP